MLGLKVKRSNRSILRGKEIDLYLPEYNFAIEYNGVYWHSESQGKDEQYHYDKWKTCQEQGIQLIQIWEDDWNNNKQVILKSIAHKLGLSKKLHLIDGYSSHSTYARKTVVKVLTNDQTKSFLDENHIEGYSSGTYYLGLEDDNGEIRAVMVLKKELDNELNIVRFATQGTVVGAFSKLLRYAQYSYNPQSFIAFSDNCMSNGGLYENNGFIADKAIPPDYMYVFNDKRCHKLEYGVKRFKDDVNLKYEEGLAEKELAALNKMPRIWDAGKTRYHLTVEFDR